jgi:hypothetical protein
MTPVRVIFSRVVSAEAATAPRSNEATAPHPIKVIIHFLEGNMVFISVI